VTDVGSGTAVSDIDRAIRARIGKRAHRVYVVATLAATECPRCRADSAERRLESFVCSARCQRLHRLAVARFEPNVAAVQHSDGELALMMPAMMKRHNEMRFARSVRPPSTQCLM